MCPRGDIYFFMSRNNHQEFYTSNRYPTKDKSTAGLKIQLDAYEFKVELDQQNCITVEGRHPIDKDYKA